MLDEQRSFGDICTCVENYRRVPEDADNGESNRNDLRKSCFSEFREYFLVVMFKR